MQDKIEAGYPLSSMQQGMLFHNLYHPHSGVDVEQMVITLPEKVEEIALTQAWQAVVDRHAVLRTAFRWQGIDQPQQEVYQHLDVPVLPHDWRHLPPSEQKKQFEAYLAADRQRGFELDRPPLLRLALFRLGEVSHQCLWTFHHILLDGRSFPPILEEVFAFYDALRQGRSLSLAPPTPYRAYIDWLQQQDHLKSASFWREMLQGYTSPTPFAVDQLPAEPVKPDTQYEAQEIQLSESLTTCLRSLAEQHDLTLNTFVQGAWAVLLSRYSGEPDVVFGVTRACRRSNVERAETIVGLFINTLPLRMDVVPDQPLLPWLQSLRAQQLAIRPHEHTPLVDIQAWSDVPGRLPLFESILVFENFQLEAVMKQQGGHWVDRRIRLLEQTNYPLTLNGYAGSQLLLKISYDRHRFSEAVIGRMLGHLKTLLENIPTHLDRPMVELPLLTEAEHRQLLVERSQLIVFPEVSCLHQRFEDQVCQMPEATALTFEGTSLSYQALNSRANQLAHYLRRLGVGPETLVGLYIERSPETVVSILGILKAGGAYVPLDPIYPPERLAFILEDTQAPVVVTQHSLANNLPPHQACLVFLDESETLLTQEPTDNPNISITPHNLAYVIYTSGSTGKPKGVTISHYNVTRLFDSTRHWFHFAETDVWTLFHSYAFDFSVWELWGALLYGGRLVIVPYWLSRSPDAFYKLLQTEHVTVLNQTPSAFRQLIWAETQLTASPPLALRWVIFGGEALQFNNLRPWFERHGDKTPQLVNMYGITETTVHVTYRPIRQSDLERTGSLIGVPIPDLELYLLDRHCRPVPVGVPGEIYIGGAGLGRGYFNRPQLTEVRFIPHPFADNPSARLYRSGDLARYLPDGDLEYLGRIDHQIQLRGYRIELGEIETILAQHPAVKTSLVVASDSGSPPQKQLVAYLVPAQPQPPTVSDLRAFLSKQLPDYMIPTAFVMLEAIPLTPNGKVNRHGLPAPDLARPELIQAYVAPRNEIEEQLVKIWVQVLPVERVGIHDDFFELGGHSLLATQTIARIQQRFQVTLPLQAIFDTPTIAELAVRLVQQESEHLAQEDLAEMLATLENLPEDQVQGILKRDESLFD